MKPSYYDKFSCIADKCQFTCCQEWKIGVDDETLENWKNIPAEKLLRDKSDLKGEYLSDYVVSKEDNPVMGLCSNKLCPFLNSSKLCNIVLEYGEECISETCHTFPREEHEFSSHSEQTLMLCCPHVIDLLNNEKRFEIIDKEKLEDDLFLLREKLIEFIQEEKTGGKELGIEEKLLIIYYILLECYENDQYDPDEWLLVPELTNTLDEIEKSRIDTLNECNELMLDLIDNYLKEGVYEKYLLILNEEAVKLEELLETEDELPELEITNLERFNEKWNEYKALMEKALSQEFFGELIIDEDDMEGFLVKYQWIIMEYSLLKHFCYLHYRKYGELNYENIKNYMVIAFRIMGFDDDDIYEYMENSFEELVWDWGYMALLLI